MSENMIARGSKFFILILTITGIILWCYSAALAGQTDCRCFTSSMIDGALAAAGPEATFSGAGLVPSCSDDPSIPQAHIDFLNPNEDSYIQIIRFEVGININDEAFCSWSMTGQESRSIEGLSKGQSHSCRNAIVNSEAWKLMSCPNEPTN